MKDNSECASLRHGNLPKAEAVRTVDKNANKGAAVAAAKKQNMNDEDPTALTIIPNNRIPAPPSTQGYTKN